MTQPSNLKVKRLVELDALPPASTDVAWMYAVANNVDYKVDMAGFIEDAVDVVSADIIEATIDRLEDPVEGANLVAFQDEYASAVALSVADVLKTLPVSVLRFIPKAEHAAIKAGTSTYDCSVALNAALLEHKNLYFPAGRYGIGSTLLLPDGTALLGEGWSVRYESSQVRAPTGSVLFLLPGSDCDMIRQSGKTFRYSLTIKNLALNGNGENQTSVDTPDGTYSMYQFDRNGMFFEALYNTVLDNVMVYNMRGAGIAIHGDNTAGCTNVFLNFCHGYNCRTYNIYTNGSLTDMRISGGDYGFGRVANLRLTSSNTVEGAVFWASQCRDITDPDTHSTGLGAVVNGGILVAGNNNKISGCRSEGNAGHGIKLVGNSNKVSDTAIYFNAATSGTSGSFDGINDAGTGNVFEDVNISQSVSSAYALRKAIKLESGHGSTTIRGSQLTHIGANAAAVQLPVEGLSFSSGDKADFSWAGASVNAYNSSNIAIQTTFTKIGFQTEVEDARGEWSTSNHEFTAAEAGVYRIEANVTCNNDVDGNSFVTGLHINNTLYGRSGQQRAGSNTPVANYLTHVVKLEAGDVMDVRALVGTGPKNTTGGQGITWIRISQVAS